MERIISADSHVTIRHKDVLAHLPAKHHDAYWEGKLRALRRFVGEDATVVPDDDQVGLDEDHKETWSAAGRKGAFDPHERLKDMDTDKVDVEVWLGTIVNPKLVDYIDPILGDPETNPGSPGGRKISLSLLFISKDQVRYAPTASPGSIRDRSEQDSCRQGRNPPSQSPALRNGAP